MNFICLKSLGITAVMLKNKITRSPPFWEGFFFYTFLKNIDHEINPPYLINSYSVAGRL
jgi:hypothetical protein